MLRSGPIERFGPQPFKTFLPWRDIYRILQGVPFVSHLCHEITTSQKGQLIMLLIGLLVLITLALSLGWLRGGRSNMTLRNMGLISLGLSLVLFFTTQ
jgi:hypothetical protein